MESLSSSHPADTSWSINLDYDSFPADYDDDKETQ